MRKMSRIPVQQAVDDSDCSVASCSSSLESSQTPEMEEIRVLAVDDNKIDRKLIEMLLKTSSCNVTAVESAERALDVLGLSGKGSPQPGKGSEFDLIITDYCMPQMTGYDLLTRVKDHSSLWKEIPVVVMSSENLPLRIRRCLDEGASEFLIKPVQLADVERLRCHVREAKELRDEFSSPVSAKRKGTSSSNRQVRGVDRRTRRGLTVV